jgi:hypothetical protein
LPLAHHDLHKRLKTIALLNKTTPCLALPCLALPCLATPRQTLPSQDRFLSLVGIKLLKIWLTKALNKPKLNVYTLFHKKDMVYTP